MKELKVRELKESDIDLLARYWYDATPEHLKGMGADPQKLPPEEAFKRTLHQQLKLPIEQRNAYVIIWEVDGKPSGHSNTKPFEFGDYAYMHLHLWRSDLRGKGYGTELVRMTLPFYFENLDIKTLYSEPYALNPAPNKTFEKLGFELEKEYITKPGPINFEQPVKRWKLTREKFAY